MESRWCRREHPAGCSAHSVFRALVGFLFLFLFFINKMRDTDLMALLLNKRAKADL